MYKYALHGCIFVNTQLLPSNVAVCRRSTFTAHHGKHLRTSLGLIVWCTHTSHFPRLSSLARCIYLYILSICSAGHRRKEHWPHRPQSNENISLLCLHVHAHSSWCSIIPVHAHAVHCAGRVNCHVNGNRLPSCERNRTRSNIYEWDLCFRYLHLCSDFRKADI